MTTEHSNSKKTTPANRHYSAIDRLLINAELALKTISPGATQATRPSPANDEPYVALDEIKLRHVAGLMRINHTGEVCAQALYQGQALTAKLDNVKQSMETAAKEEEDHLAWCDERLKQLNSKPSALNPLFYAASFGIGALAGAVSDKVSLGFVAATEEKVCEHLTSHLHQLPPEDGKSQAILEQMLEDEAQHATQALEAGGMPFPPPAKAAMTLISKIMTKTTYYI